MRLLSSTNFPGSRVPAWSAAVLTGVCVPLIAMFVSSTPLALAAGPIFTMSLMGIGIIAAAESGRFWLGVALALLNTACLTALAVVFGMMTPALSLAIVSATIIASCSFAARGALFRKTLSNRAWLMALFVVLGEASVLLIVGVFPGALPDWILSLLPAQWASISIQTALTGTWATPALLALAGTAATTLLAAKLWFRRWPYLLMFTTWLGLSALVYLSFAPMA